MNGVSVIPAGVFYAYFRRRLRSVSPRRTGRVHRVSRPVERRVARLPLRRRTQTRQRIVPRLLRPRGLRGIGTYRGTRFPYRVRAAQHLRYIHWSERAQTDTAYTVELFDAELLP